LLERRLFGGDGDGVMVAGLLRYRFSLLFFFSFFSSHETF